jgi:CheY-like chemotaxis protein
VGPPAGRGGIFFRLGDCGVSALPLPFSPGTQSTSEGGALARICIIEDDGQVRDVLQQMLERDGHEVVQAPDGAVGLEACRAAGADLVMIDLFLPGANGWAVVRSVQAELPGVPVIIMTGGGFLEVLEQGSASTLDGLRGVAEFRLLRKPIRRAPLRAAVTELLGGRAERPDEQ